MCCHWDWFGSCVCLGTCRLQLSGEGAERSSSQAGLGFLTGKSSWKFPVRGKGGKAAGLGRGWAGPEVSC